jgi:hypothetical protein
MGIVGATLHGINDVWLQNVAVTVTDDCPNSQVTNETPCHGAAEGEYVVVETECISYHLAVAGHFTCH